ncbi:MAG: WbqC family protein, partial [Bacteroidota bacterium]
MSVVLHPTYFPSIVTFAVIVQKGILWEAFDNFQKQTYRNRCYICTDQGRHMMNIPIKHVGVNEGRQL